AQLRCCSLSLTVRRMISVGGLIRPCAAEAASSLPTVRRIVHGDTAHGITIANVDVGTRTGVEHERKILRRHNDASIAVDIGVANEIPRCIGYELSFARVVDQRREEIAEINHCRRAEASANSLSSAPQANLDLLHGFASKRARR